MTDMRYMDQLDLVVADAVGLIRQKSEGYGDSWKRRGGPGAWFTTVRPWDRLETILRKFDGDIFAAIEADPSGDDGTALACVRDTMNYLILIEAHARVAHGVGPHGPARKAGCEWCGRPIPGVGGGVFCTTGCSDAKWEHDHPGEPYHPPSCQRPGVLRPGTPEDGGHHAVETAGELTQDDAITAAGATGHARRPGRAGRLPGRAHQRVPREGA